MNEVMIVGATRTPVGSFRGSLSSLSAVELGAVAVRRLLENSQLCADQVDELIFGQVLTAGCGQNPARQTALMAGLPVSTPATTVNLVCGAGLKRCSSPRRLSAAAMPTWLSLAARRA